MGALIVARRSWVAAARGRARSLRVEPWRLPGRVRRRLEVALGRAGWRVTPEVAVETWGIGAVATLVLFGALATPLVPVVAVLSVAVPIAVLSAQRHRADRLARTALPDLVRAIAADLRTGGTIPGALATRARGPGGEGTDPLAVDLRRVAARLALGASLAEALAPWAHERPIPGIRAVGGALVLGAELGGAGAVALDGLARSLDDGLAVAAETRAHGAQARVSAVVVAVAPLGSLALSALTDRAALGALMARPLGRGCLLLGLTLDAIAVVWMRRLVRDRWPVW
jgi:tight adherence protein B